MNSYQFSKFCRASANGRTVKAVGLGEPPGFLVAPITIATRAIKEFHSHGATPAREYLSSSKVGQWATHENPSMATNNQRVLDGFDWYIERHALAPAKAVALGKVVDVDLAGDARVLATRIDVVLDTESGALGRVIWWDGLDLSESIAPALAYLYVLALDRVMPQVPVVGIELLQARRQQAAVVSRERAADARLAALALFRKFSGEADAT